MAREFVTPLRYPADPKQLASALERNRRQLETFLNTDVVRLEAGGTVNLPANSTVAASLIITLANLLAQLLTVDGAASGIDADLLDGQHGAYYLPAGSYTAADVLAKLLTVDGAASGLDADLLDGQSSAYYLPAGSYTAADVLAKLLTVDGSASGLDADLLDGTSLAALALLAGATFTGRLAVNGSFLNIGSPSTLTIATGAVTATQSNHSIDTEAAAATDDLVTINGGSEGDLLWIRAEDNARDVVVKHGTGNIYLDGRVDRTLNHTRDRLPLINRSGNAWHQYPGDNFT